MRTKFWVGVGTALLLGGLLARPLTAQNWPQPAGPNGTWQLATGNAPSFWSVALNKNIVWRSPMPGGGQGGIIKWGDKLFLTTFPEYKEGEPKFVLIPVRLFARPAQETQNDRDRHGCR